MRVGIVMNPGARRARRLPPSRVRREFSRRGADVEVVSVRGRRLGRAAERAARRSDVVVAAGGDGTVNAVVPALLENDVPLGLLAAGTLNHFARDVGLDLPLEQATKVIVEGRTRRVDVGLANGQPFLNNLSLGLYPEIVRRRDELRQRLGHSKWRAFGHATWHVVRRDPRYLVRLHMEGQELRRRVPFVFVGNNAYDVDLWTLGRRSRLDEGVLSLYYAQDQGDLALVRLAARTLVGRLHQSRAFRMTTLPELWIESPTRGLPAALDGERMRLSTPIHCESLPRALRVRVPRRTPP